MADPYWLSVAAAMEHYAKVAAIVLGGIWAYFRFGLFREGETKLEIDLTHTTHPNDSSSYLVELDVTLINRGTTLIAAQHKRCPAYSDPDESLKYGGDLLLRFIPSDLPLGEQVSWFSEGSNATRPLPGDIELDLLYEYEGKEGGLSQTDFWLEPGDVAHVGRAIVLNPGTYLVMVTFVGDRRVTEFWRRVFVIQVPKSSAPVHTAPLRRRAPR
jgi:hypothetical protein